MRHVPLSDICAHCCLGEQGPIPKVSGKRRRGRIASVDDDGEHQQQPPPETGRRSSVGPVAGGARRRRSDWGQDERDERQY